MRITDRGGCRTFPVSGFAECEAQAAGFPEKPRKLEKRKLQ
jgi:hypothetical protein